MDGFSIYFLGVGFGQEKIDYILELIQIQMISSPVWNCSWKKTLHGMVTGQPWQRFAKFILCLVHYSRHAYPSDLSKVSVSSIRA